VDGCFPRFSSAADRHPGIPHVNGLGGRNNRLQPAATEAIEREGPGPLGNTLVDGRQARQVHVMDIGMDHIAEDHVLNVFRLDPARLTASLTTAAPTSVGGCLSSHRHNRQWPCARRC
jgi:hypothetical protein